MQIEITDIEREELGNLVEQRYRDLKEEIYKTETWDYKDGLKRREEALLGILRKLGRTPTIETAA